MFIVENTKRIKITFNNDILKHFGIYVCSFLCGNEYLKWLNLGLHSILLYVFTDQYFTSIFSYHFMLFSYIIFWLYSLHWIDIPQLI